MPIYDFLCSNCDSKRNDVFVKAWDEEVKCNQCHENMQKLVPTNISANVFPADGVHLKHVSPEGHTFHSTKEMRQYEKDKNVQLGYLGHA